MSTLLVSVSGKTRRQGKGLATNPHELVIFCGRFDDKIMHMKVSQDDDGKFYLGASVKFQTLQVSTLSLCVRFVNLACDTQKIYSDLVIGSDANHVDYCGPVHQSHLIMRPVTSIQNGSHIVLILKLISTHT